MGKVRINKNQATDKKKKKESGIGAGRNKATGRKISCDG